MKLWHRWLEGAGGCALISAGFADIGDHPFAIVFGIAAVVLGFIALCHAF